MKDEKRTITIGNQDITFSGLFFSKWFGMLSIVTKIMVLIATIKYVFNL